MTTVNLIRSEFLLKQTILCTNLCSSKQFCAQICARANNFVLKFVLKQTILFTNLCSSKKKLHKFVLKQTNCLTLFHFIHQLQLLAFLLSTFCKTFSTKKIVREKQILTINTNVTMTIISIYPYLSFFACNPIF